MGSFVINSTLKDNTKAHEPLQEFMILGVNYDYNKIA